MHKCRNTPLDIADRVFREHETDEHRSPWSHQVCASLATYPVGDMRPATCLQFRLVPSPSSILRNQFSCALADAQHRQHRVDAGHHGEDTCVRNAHPLQPADLQMRVDDCHRVALDVAHLGRAGRMVDGMGHAPAILGQCLVGDDLRPRCHLALDPVLERRLLGYLARCL
ncbi:hypothetical protein VTN77DRAFT_675 [Rasamsonia byssochlamydoides]|uniref:uncharacterized protein n=1 Tax=Rasamsonia byssochlamydoides TaxID=89139 RepID=UPI0037448764